MSDAETILRIADVTTRTGLGKSTIYRFVTAGTFPHPIQISAGATGWLASEVAEWIRSRPRVPTTTEGQARGVDRRKPGMPPGIERKSDERERRVSKA